MSAVHAATSSMQATRAPGQALLVIPAYKPAAGLPDAVTMVMGSGVFQRAIVVDDGSGPEFAPIFERLSAMEGVTVLRHAVNLGKGAALKTALNHAACDYPEALGVVTADADGQH